MLIASVEPPSSAVRTSAANRVTSATSSASNPSSAKATKSA
ncbi:hypothetical protein J2S44_001007 [Catenuloplanes niger]|uniref:Uncharacterized protein n=1 Tax=Catenuloplanes niger TaxID=587534 RepID=A0AAE4CQQ6_9ACTN|nr:hypothetical protein [Catenuloplanes niger]